MFMVRVSRLKPPILQGFRCPGGALSHVTIPVPTPAMRGAMLKEFRQFALKGNVVDLAVGIIIGAAFGKITTSLVNDVIMPPIGALLGKVDFSNLFINLSGTAYESLDAAKKAGAPVIAYGSFINTILDF